jgi:hypothetical protein
MTVPADIVESYLLGIMTDPLRRDATLTFRTPSGDREFRLTARGVDELLMQEFARQNIVHAVWDYSLDTTVARARDVLARLLFDKDAATSLTDPECVGRIENTLKEVTAGRRILIEVEPVYGAVVMILAASAEWT